MVSDLKLSIRQLGKSPGFTLTAILTLALGIGATTAIFTLVQQILLQSLPVKDPAQLWRVGDAENCCVNGGLPVIKGKLGDWSLFSYEQYRQFRANTPGFSSLAAFQSGTNQAAVRRSGAGHVAAPFYVEYVSGNAFDTLGIRPSAGRLLRPGDDVRGSATVAVISYQTWVQQFGQDPSVVGSPFYIDGTPFTIVGVAPPGFFGEQLRDHAPAFWLPINALAALGDKDQLLDHPELQWLNLIGRVEPGANIAALQAQMQLELQQFLHSPLSKVTPALSYLIPRQYLRLTPGGGGVQMMQDSYRAALHLLMCISCFVLLIACANLANLMLVKAVGYAKQAAVQAALGARRNRLVRQALVQSVVLSVLGGLAALPVAWGGAELILHLTFQRQPLGVNPEPSVAVLGFAFGVSLLTGMLFGIAPAWVAAHVNCVDALRGANRATGRRTTFAQKALVITQAAVSTVLVCAAGLLVLSLRDMMQQHLGFETANRYVLNLDPQMAGYKPQQLDAFYRQLEERLRSIPGVQRVAYSIYTPLEGENWGEDVFIQGQRPMTPGSQLEPRWDRVSVDYFNAIGTKLLHGRQFTESDDQTGRKVAIVNQSFVKQLLRGRDPLGVHFSDWFHADDTYAIVGVVEDAQYWGPDEKIHPMYYLPAKQWTALPASNPRAADYARFIASSHYMTSVVIETHGAAPGLEGQVTRTLSEINPDLTITRFQSFARQVELAFSQQDMIAQLTSLFGILALVLAGVGLYGVTAYGVAQRRSEIGIRMALGADKARVQQLILRGAFVQVGLGLLIGIPAAVLNGQFMAAHLFGITAYDPLVLASAVLVLALAALIASVLPARRAAAVEPMTALRVQ